MFISRFLRWWLFTCLTFVFVVLLYAFDFFNILIEKDITYLSFFIIGIYFISSLYVGFTTYKSQNQYIDVDDTTFLWFITELLVALGMIGTVIGFIVMLGSSFAEINIQDAQSVKNALTDMALGMSTALYTTLTGLVTSQLLKVQLVNAES